MDIIMNASKDEKYREEHSMQFLTDDEEYQNERSHRKYTPVHMSDKEREKLQQLYSNVVVQDFEDEYHMPKEEREKQREQYAKFFKLRNGYTKKIRRLDKYVEACRLCLEIIKELAETNGVYSKEKFFEMALKGKIVINGMRFPKYQGRGKKNINWDFVMDYILDTSRDPLDLIRTEDDEPDVQKEATFEEIFSKEEQEMILTPITKEEEKDRNLAVICPERFLEDGIILPEKKKDRKALIKINPGYLKVLKDIDKQQRGKRRNAHIWDLDEDDMEYIREYDAKYNKKYADEPPVFNGNFRKQSDIDAYLYQMEEWEKRNEIVDYNGRAVTREKYEEIQLRAAMEENGWNLRNLYGNKEREKRIEKAKSRDKKRIKELKKLLSKIQSRADSDDEDYEEKINKKKRKGSKKNKKKGNKIVFDAVGVDDEDIAIMKKKMKKMKWGG